MSTKRSANKENNKIIKLLILLEGLKYCAYFSTWTLKYQVQYVLDVQIFLK